MSNKVVSQGTTFKIGASILANTTYTSVAGFKSISGIGGGAQKELDGSDLSSATVEPYWGLMDEGSVKIGLDYVSGDAGQLAMNTNRLATNSVAWQIALPGGGRYDFQGKVTSFEVSASTSELITVDATVRISNATLFTAGS